MNTDIGQRHDSIASALLAALVGLAAVGAVINAAVSATGHPLLAVVALGALVSAAAVVCRASRWLRERREDAADGLAGAVWRAQHTPGHLQVADDRAGVA